MAHAIYSGPHPTDVENAYWSNIDKYHLSYLNAEESPQKIHEKERLENVIKGFLGHIPHNRKFILTTTAQIFHKSVTEVKNFSIVNLATAWSVIGQYAQNLISQPWRKEFHKIQMYSGYYEHNVRHVLVGGEQMLIYMGYVPIGDGVMCLDGPVDPDRVALVSKDCFIASTECQVMFQIYSEMILRTTSITYEDIFRFREQNICDTNKAIIELSTPHQRPMSMYSTMGGLPPYSSSTCSRAQRSCTMKEPLHHYQWPTGHYMPNEPYNNTNIIPPHHLPPHHMYPTNGYSYAPVHRSYYQSVPPAYPRYVPTGQLIEYETPHVRNYSTEKSHKRNTSEPLRHDRDHLLGDEVDSYHSKERVQNWLCYDEPETDQADLARNVCEEITKLKVSDPVHEFRGAKKKDRKSIKEPSFPTRLVRQPSEPDLAVTQKTSKTGRNHSTTNTDGNMWECSKCTFHNKPTVDICEMCDKSRIQGNECLPLISGGRECHNCTLINERGEEECKACGECLKDSPTYI